MAKYNVANVLAVLEGFGAAKNANQMRAQEAQEQFRGQALSMVPQLLRAQAQKREAALAPYAAAFQAAETPESKAAAFSTLQQVMQGLGAEPDPGAYLGSVLSWKGKGPINFPTFAGPTGAMPAVPLPGFRDPRAERADDLLQNDLVGEAQYQYRDNPDAMRYGAPGFAAEAANIRKGVPLPSFRPGIPIPGGMGATTPGPSVPTTPIGQLRNKGLSVDDKRYQAQRAKDLLDAEQRLTELKAKTAADQPENDARIENQLRTRANGLLTQIRLSKRPGERLNLIDQYNSLATASKGLLPPYGGSEFQSGPQEVSGMAPKLRPGDVAGEAQGPGVRRGPTPGATPMQEVTRTETPIETNLRRTEAVVSDMENPAEKQKAQADLYKQYLGFVKSPAYAALPPEQQMAWFERLNATGEELGVKDLPVLNPGVSPNVKAQIQQRVADRTLRKFLADRGYEFGREKEAFHQEMANLKLGLEAAAKAAKGTKSSTLNQRIISARQRVNNLEGQINRLNFLAIKSRADDPIAAAKASQEAAALTPNLEALIKEYQDIATQAETEVSITSAGSTPQAMRTVGGATSSAGVNTKGPRQVTLNGNSFTMTYQQLLNDLKKSKRPEYRANPEKWANRFWNQAR